MATRGKLTPQQFQEVSERRPEIWIRDAALDWLIILLSLTAVGYFRNPLVLLIAWLVIGNRQHALALLGHDGTHFTISNRKKFNDILTNFLTWIPLGLTLNGYRNLHGFHHQHLGTENDPEVVYKHMKAEHWELPSKPAKVLLLAARDLVGGGLHDYKIIFRYSAPENKLDYIPLATVHTVFIIISIFMNLWWVPMIWYISVLTSFVMFFRLRLWLEHQGTDHAHRLRLNWWQGALLAPHLSWHHWEHHHWPSIPYYNLARLRAYTPEEPVLDLKELLKFYEIQSEIAPGAKI